MNHLTLPIRILPVVIRGWSHLGWVFCRKIFTFFKEKSILERIFFGFVILQVVSSAMGWIQYKILFNDTIETVVISIRWNVFFIFGSLVNFFFTGFWKSPWVWTLFLVVQTTLLGLFGLAHAMPKTAFTEMMLTSDYSYSAFYYIFSFCLLASWVIGILLFREDRTRFSALALSRKS